jgi:hypothetical protein
MWEEFATLDEAKRMVLVLFPNAKPLPWGTTEDGNYRHLNFMEGAGRNGKPVARILIPLAD